MCMLLKLHYAKFDVSRLFCSKVMEEKPLGVCSTPLGKGRVNATSLGRFNTYFQPVEAGGDSVPLRNFVFVDPN